MNYSAGFMNVSARKNAIHCIDKNKLETENYSLVI